MYAAPGSDTRSRQRTFRRATTSIPAGPHHPNHDTSNRHGRSRGPPPSGPPPYERLHHLPPGEEEPRSPDRGFPGPRAVVGLQPPRPNSFRSNHYVNHPAAPHNRNQPPPRKDRPHPWHSPRAPPSHPPRPFTPHHPGSAPPELRAGPRDPRNHRDRWTNRPRRATPRAACTPLSAAVGLPRAGGGAWLPWRRDRRGPDGVGTGFVGCATLGRDVVG
jgi:hypothetical protein